MTAAAQTKGAPERAPRPLFGPAQARARTRELADLIKEFLVEGEDYGLVSGAPKPILLKSGAEKLCQAFGLAKKVEVIGQLEDWEGGFFHYIVKISLLNKAGDWLEAEGLGCCNTREARLAGPDVYALANTILKMAEKRALVDAVLSATSTSALFTQDLEDFGPRPEPRPVERAPVRPRESGSLAPGKILALRGTLKMAGLNEAELLREWNLGALDQLKPENIQPVLEWIQKRREADKKETGREG